MKDMHAEKYNAFVLGFVTYTGNRFQKVLFYFVFAIRSQLYLWRIVEKLTSFYFVIFKLFHLSFVKCMYSWEVKIPKSVSLK